MIKIKYFIPLFLGILIPISCFHNCNSEAEICVVKYHDMDGDGIKDPNEPLLGGWSIIVGNIHTIITSSNGPVCVKVKAPGSYFVQEVVQSGWTPTDPPNGQVNVVVSPGDKVKLYFGNKATGIICIGKFHDLDMDGVKDPDESFLDNWTIDIASGNYSQTVVTDSTGMKCIEVPAPDTYTVSEVIPSGWCVSTPPNGQTQVVVKPGDTIQVLFGNYECNTTETAFICFFKFNDLDGDGIWDNPGEPFMSGWTINITGGGFSAQDTTYSSDYNCIEVPAPGTYTVSEVIQSGWCATTPSNGQTQITVQPGQTITVPFGNQECDTTGGSGILCLGKFHDLDGDGVMDPGENLMSGWTIEISGIGNSYYQQVTTDSSDLICIEIPAPDSYKVSEILQSGWVPTSPSNGDTIVFIQSGQNINLLFGNQRKDTTGSAMICVTKFNDIDGDGIMDPNEPLMEGWTVDVVGTGGSNFQIVTARDTVCIEVPAPDTYTISEVIQPGWTPTTPPNGSTTVTLQPGQSVHIQFGNVKDTMNMDLKP
jgi:hypothetical protein